jgi:redox-sensitive bicupin YhaK (pirin superfamily)
MLMSPNVWSDAATNQAISHGLGDFIYMAIGHFQPNDGAPMHPHRDVDIVTLVSSGEVGHKGTNGDGTVVRAPGVQVQRAGTGMSHSEFSTLDEKAEFVQLWFVPPQQGLQPDYRNFDIPRGNGLITVLGGDSTTSFDNNTCCRIGYLAAGERLQSWQECIAIVFQGSGSCNDAPISYGDLIEADALTITATDSLGIILITVSKREQTVS